LSFLVKWAAVAIVAVLALISVAILFSGGGLAGLAASMLILSVLFLADATAACVITGMLASFGLVVLFDFLRHALDRYCLQKYLPENSIDLSAKAKDVEKVRIISIPDGYAYGGTCRFVVTSTEEGKWKFTHNIQWDHGIPLVEILKDDAIVGYAAKSTSGKFVYISKEDFDGHFAEEGSYKQFSTSEDLKNVLPS
jgi:hypothetical protein